MDNGGCEHKCLNYGGQSVCQCYNGYLLADDEKSCYGQLVLHFDDFIDHLICSVINCIALHDDLS